jgi:hypothetical protein
MQASIKQSVQESIPLRPDEIIYQQTREQLNAFRSQASIPCLWVTAHVPNPIPRDKSPALEMLRTNRGRRGTADNIANAYKEFLQKQLIRLNDKALRYKSTGLCFHFRGTLERNGGDPTGSHLHYHFSLWAPNGLFRTDPLLMLSTKDKLITLWHQRVNDQETEHYKPIQIDIITNQKDADHIATYEAKANPVTQAYEIFDDWSLAGCTPVAP